MTNLKPDNFSRLIFFSLIATLGGMAPMAQAGNATPAVEAIILGMAKAGTANRAGFHHYTVTRDYTLYGKGGQKVKSQVIADISFRPPQSKSFVVKKAEGDGMGEKIARQMLAKESELTGNRRSEISSENYTFAFLGEATIAGRHCYVLRLEPKRKEETLISGKIWIDSETFLPHRVEGDPAKKPCWWVRDLHVVISYGDAGGMWLQKSLEFTAGIRFFGESRMLVRDLKYDIPEQAIAKPVMAPALLSPGTDALHKPSAKTKKTGIKSRS